MQEADIGTTDMAFPPAAAAGASRRRRQGDEVLMVKFFTKPLKNEEESVKEGRPIFDDREYISIRVPGSRNEKMDPVEQRHIDRFPDDYAAFKQREDYKATQGTPLERWPGVERSQVEELKFFNVFTVEQLAGMPDSSNTNFMGIAHLRTRAKLFLESAQANSVNEATAAELKELRTENQTLKTAMEDMQQQLAELKNDSVSDSGRRDKPSGGRSRANSGK